MQWARWFLSGRVVAGTILLSLVGLALAQGGALQVFGPVGLVVSVDGSFVGQTTSEPGGLLVANVHRGRRAVAAFDAGVLVWEASIEVRPGEVAVARVPTWPMQFAVDGGGPRPQFVVDREGNIILPGWVGVSVTGVDLGERGVSVRKLDAYGNEMWIREFGSSGRDEASGVAVDRGGNILVVGWTTGALGDQNAGMDDAFVRKLDGDGNEVWTHQFGSEGVDRALAVTVDGSGNVLVVGETSRSIVGPWDGNPTGNVFARKLDPRGRELWTHEFGSAGNDIPTSVAVDRHNDVFVAGVAAGPIGGPQAERLDPFVRKLNAGGSEVWTHQFGTDGMTYLHGMALDDGGNVFVVGETTGVLGVRRFGPIDAFVRKLDARGSEVWTHQFGTDGLDFGYNTAVNGAGNVVIVGSTTGALGGPNAGGFDAFVRVVDMSGRAIWTYQFGSTESDEARSVAVAPSGLILVGGGSSGALSSEQFGGRGPFLHRLLPPPAAR